MKVQKSLIIMRKILQGRINPLFRKELLNAIIFLLYFFFNNSLFVSEIFN